MQELIQQDIQDQLFPTDNVMEVPMLRFDMQATACSIPFVCYGEQKRTFNMQGTGTLHFYTDDYRFRTIYEHPDKILQHNPENIVEPNYSLFNETPVAFGLTSIYKKRFLARALQERGIRVFVDLNVSPKYYKINMLGVPTGWSAFSTRGYSDRLNQLAFEYELARTWADGNELIFIVYGGGKSVKQFCREKKCIYISPVIAIKNKAKSFERMKEVIEFMGEKIKAEDLMPNLSLLPQLEQMLNNQIKDYRK